MNFSAGGEGVFADLLREARIERGMTVAELAARSAIAPTVIAEYEAGYTQPTFGTAVRLLNALGKDLHLVDRDSRLQCAGRSPTDSSTF